LLQIDRLFLKLICDILNSLSSKKNATDSQIKFFDILLFLGRVGVLKRIF